MSQLARQLVPRLSARHPNRGAGGLAQELRVSQLARHGAAFRASGMIPRPLVLHALRPTGSAAGAAHACSDGALQPERSSSGASSSASGLVGDAGRGAASHPGPSAAAPLPPATGLRSANRACNGPPPAPPPACGSARAPSAPCSGEAVAAARRSAASFSAAALAAASAPPTAASAHSLPQAARMSARAAGCGRPRCPPAATSLARAPDAFAAGGRPLRAAGGRRWGRCGARQVRTAACEGRRGSVGLRYSPVCGAELSPLFSQAPQAGDWMCPPGHRTDTRTCWATSVSQVACSGAGSVGAPGAVAQLGGQAAA